MAKEIVWSFRAQRDRMEILDYWRRRNKSNTYSTKLNRLFEQAMELISNFPQIGKPVDIRGIRVKIVRDYSIFYREANDIIEILTLWDNRRNPDMLHKILSR